MEDAIMSGDREKVESLMKFYNVKTLKTLNGQSAFRIALETHYWKLLSTCESVTFDDVVGGPKTTGDLRPDIFYKWTIDGDSYGIHIEYDENSLHHEDDETRLEWIENTSGTNGRVYVIRVDGGHGTKDPVCTRVKNENYEYYKVTNIGKDVAKNVGDAVIERIGWIKNRMGPGVDRSRKIYF